MSGISTFFKKRRENLEKAFEDKSKRRSSTDALPQRSKSTTVRAKPAPRPAPPQRPVYIPEEHEYDMQVPLPLPLRPPPKDQNKDVAACATLVREVYALELKQSTMPTGEEATEEDVKTSKQTRRRIAGLYAEIEKTVHKWRAMEVAWTDQDRHCIEMICRALEDGRHGGKNSTRQSVVASRGYIQRAESVRVNVPLVTTNVYRAGSVRTTVASMPSRTDASAATSTWRTVSDVDGTSLRELDEHDRENSIRDSFPY